MRVSQAMVNQIRDSIHETCDVITTRSSLCVRMDTTYESYRWRIQVGKEGTYGESFDHTTSEHAWCFLDGLIEALKLTGDWKES